MERQQRSVLRWFGAFTAGVCLFVGYSYIQAIGGLENIAAPPASGVAQSQGRP